LQFPVSASVLSLPRLNIKITEIQVDFQSETNAKSISSGVDKILAAESHSELSYLVSSTDLSVNKQTSGMVGKISNNRIKNPVLKDEQPVVESGAEEGPGESGAEEGPVQCNFPKLKLSGGRRREGRDNRVTDDRYYLVVQFKFTFEEKEYHVIYIDCIFIINYFN